MFIFIVLSSIFLSAHELRASWINLIKQDDMPLLLRGRVANLDEPEWSEQ